MMEFPEIFPETNRSMKLELGHSECLTRQQDASIQGLNWLQWNRSNI
jgi:hypothetical protein